MILGSAGLAVCHGTDDIPDLAAFQGFCHYWFLRVALACPESFIFLFLRGSGFAQSNFASPSSTFCFSTFIVFNTFPHYPQPAALPRHPLWHDKL
jgi:hypothetical protein